MEQLDESDGEVKHHPINDTWGLAVLVHCVLGGWAPGKHRKSSFHLSLRNDFTCTFFFFFVLNGDEGGIRPTSEFLRPSWSQCGPLVLHFFCLKWLEQRPGEGKLNFQYWAPCSEWSWHQLHRSSLRRFAEWEWIFDLGFLMTSHEKAGTWEFFSWVSWHLLGSRFHSSLQDLSWSHGFQAEFLVWLMSKTRWCHPFLFSPHKWLLRTDEVSCLWANVSNLLGFSSGFYILLKNTEDPKIPQDVCCGFLNLDIEIGGQL